MMARFAPRRYQLGTGDLVTTAPFLDRVAARLVDVVVMFCFIGIVELFLVFPFHLEAEMGVGNGVAFSYAVGMAIAAASIVILYGAATWTVVVLSAHLDAHGRGWHDKLAGTVVVRRPSKGTDSRLQRQLTTLAIEPRNQR